MASSIRDPKTRAWEGVTLGQMVARIAGEAGLEVAVSAAMARIRLPYIAQTSESDLHLLTRIARDNGGIAKPAAARLVVVRHGESPGGETVALGRERLRSWRWERGERETYVCVTAEWQELGSGERRSVTVGEGTPPRNACATPTRRRSRHGGPPSRISTPQRGASSGSLSTSRASSRGSSAAGSPICPTCARA